MSFFDRIRRAFVPLRRTDPRFGQMLFQRMDGRHGSSYWECTGSFAGLEVEYFVDAEEEGPSAAQREHVDGLEARWSELEPRLARFLEGRAGTEDLGEHPSRLADWSLASISLPADPRAADGVEIGYVERDGGELLAFEMSGLEPRAIRVGG